jgi:hypothetical protein
MIALPNPGKDPKVLLLITTDKLFGKVILKLNQRHIESRKMLNASQFGFRARHSMTLQSMRLADHATLNFNNKMSAAAVFLDIEKAFDTTLHTDLLYMLYKMISSFLSQRKFSFCRGRNL